MTIYMKICLHKCEENVKNGPFVTEITERLPFNVSKVADVVFFYTVKKFKDFYLLVLDVSADVTIECQRCLHDFSHHYITNNSIAVCRSEDIAEQIMSEHEPLVSSTNEVDVTEIITDDLHLFCPERHGNVENCVFE